MKYSVFLFIVLFLTEKADASFTFNDNCKQAYTDVMCLRLAKAATRMQSEKNLNPDNQVPFIIDNYIDFLKVIIGEEQKDFVALKNSREFRLQQLAKTGENSPWHLYSQSIIYLQSGCARIKFGEYVNASLEINRAYRLLLENQKKFPGFVMNKAGLGILHSLIGTIPAKYHWAVNTLNFEGTIPEGSAEIKEAYKSVSADPQLSFLLPETVFLLSFVTLNLSADVSSALAFTEKLSKTPISSLLNESPLMIYVFATIYFRAGENDKAIQVLTNCPRTIDRYPFHYINFLLGIAKLNRLDSDAGYPILSFLGNFKGKNYIRSAYMYMAWFYLIQNDTIKYKMYCERIKHRGNDQIDNDKEALAFANKNIKPVLPLLKARLLFDGGYYLRAKNELDAYKPTDQKTALESTYRLGRIYHNWGKIDEAIPCYKETIKNGDKLPYYYAANASLQLGFIYEKRNNYSLAKQFYTNVLEMDFEEYQFSLQNKAEAGLNRINGK